MSIEDVLDRPALELEMMLTFIGFKFSRPALLAAIPDFVAALRNSLAFSTADIPPSLHSGLLSTSDFNPVGTGHPFSKLSLVAGEHLRVVTSAISNELLSTDGLSRWPCESFRKIKPFSAADGRGKGRGKRSISADQTVVPLSMSPAMLAANCSSPFVVCSVGFDRAGG